MGKLAAIFAFCLVFATPSHAAIIYTGNPFSDTDSNGLSPFWNWKVIESANFRVVFPEDLHETAQKTTQYFEEAHSFLSPLFRWQPHHKTQILVIDNRDSANGLTSPVARYGIVIWTTPPDVWSGLNVYDDWLRQLVIHEYTHFLNMDTTDSFWEPLRYIFGDTFLPNSI